MLSLLRHKGQTPKFIRRFIQISCFCVLFLSIFATISLPSDSSFSAVDILQTHLDGATIQTSKGLSHNLSEIRFGFWGLCYYDSKKKRTCSTDHHVIITLPQSERKNAAVVNWIWAKGVLFQSIATAVVTLIVILFAFKLSKNFSNDFWVYYVIILMEMLIQVAAFFFNIALYSVISLELKKLGGTGVTVRPGFGLYIFFASSMVLLIVCLGIMWYEYKKDKEQSQLALRTTIRMADMNVLEVPEWLNTTQNPAQEYNPYANHSQEKTTDRRRFLIEKNSHQKNA